MKKKAAFALLLSLALLLAGCGEQAPVTPAAAEATAPTASPAPACDLDALAAASTAEAILARHGNVELTESDYFGAQSIVYLTKELISIRAGEAQALYCDGMQLEVDESMPAGILTTLVPDEIDFQDTLGYYRSVFSIDFDGETVLSAQSEDGQLRLVTKVDSPEETQKIIESYGLAYAEGDEVTWRYVFDAETQDALSMTLTAAMDGEETVFYTGEYRYDVSQEDAIAPFAEYFTGEPRRAVTIVYARGTESELSITVSLPKTLPFRVYAEGTINHDFYLDEEFTRLYEGSAADDYSDLILYIPEAPVTAEDQALFAELLEQNTAANVLTRHAAVQRRMTEHFEGEERPVSTVYLDAESYGAAFRNDHVEYIGTRGMVGTVGEDESEFYTTLMTPEDAAAFVQGSLSNYDLTFTADEWLAEVRREDGAIVMVTELKEPEGVRSLLEDLEESFGRTYEYSEGMAVLYTYRFDEESGDLLDGAGVLYEADGTEHLLNAVVCSYDAEPFDPAATSLAAWFDEDTERCEVTVVFAAGTSDEQSVVFSLPLGTHYDVVYQGNIGEIYADPAFTREFKDTVAEGDVTLYVKA